MKLKGNFAKCFLLLLTVVFIFTSIDASIFAETSDNDKKLKNGSFEEGQSWTETYSQPNQSAVPSWNTTAFEKKLNYLKVIQTYILKV